MERDGPVEPREIEELRVAVGWDACTGTYEEILKRNWARYTARDSEGRLVGYMSVISSGIVVAFLVDLAVHPDHQRTGIGTRLVRAAARDVRDAGIRSFQVTFDESLADFYAQCGFHVFGGGVIDFLDMEWEEKA